MKRKLPWLLLLVPLALLAWAWQVASRRPKPVGVQAFQSGSAQIIPGGYDGPPLVLSPDGKYLASVAVLPLQNGLAMFDANSRAKLWEQGRRGERRWALAFSPDSQLLVVATDKPATGLALFLVETATGKPVRALMPSYNFGGALESAAFLSPARLVVSTAKGASVVDTRTGKAIRQWRFKLPPRATPRFPRLNQSHISADGTALLALSTGTRDTAVVLYDARTGKQRGSWIYPGVFRNPRLSPDGTLWALQPNASDLVTVYQAQTGKKLWGSFAAFGDGQTWVWSADSRRIFTTPGNNVAIVEARTGRDMGQLAGSINFQALALAPDGESLYTLNDSGKIYRWRAR